jgi:Zn-dependent protease with chaperone function/Zn-finger nucleic acid-binding protein
MRCPHCKEPTLHGQTASHHVQVDVCSDCHGLWLDRGKIYEFTAQPRDLEQQLDQGLRQRQPCDNTCPRCDSPLERGLLPDRDATVEQCPQCGGLWFEASELEHAVQSGPTRLDLELPAESAPIDEPVAESDPEARDKAHERLRDVAAGLLALPNLFLRSLFLLSMLYGMVALVLITLVEFRGDLLSPTTALIIGVVVAVLQFLLGPWIMDLSLRWFYKFSWVTPNELPEHLRRFVERVCEENKLRFPHFGILHDGAPQAFTYGHHPGNARVVISEGILDLLEPAEVEAVVAHELGHAHNWDMALMTLANLVPLLLYYIYRIGIRLGGGRDNKGKDYTLAVAIGAYVLYIISEYVVLWFSRTREYYADRFAGRVTNNPNALASALVKIAYGLAAQGPAVKTTMDKKKKKKEKEEPVFEPMGALRALNIFDRTAAVGMVMASSVGRGTDPRHPDVENIKSAMQWDLWNPWARWYELNSTHPLVANRLLYLTDQAAHQGQEPLVVFDRKKPESYWDDFCVDLFMMLLPWFGLLLGLGGAAAVWLLLFGGGGGQAAAVTWLVGSGAGLVLAGLGSLVKTQFVYRRDFFPHLSVAALMHKVKVSAVRPVPATLTGSIIGKGVPGLIWSEDFVIQDRTGILFLDYRQPLALWDFVFGLLRAGKYQGKEVRVSGWFRRAPVPYLEVNHIEVLDDSLPPRSCYSRHARVAVGVLLVAVGIVVALLPLLM